MDKFIEDIDDEELANISVQLRACIAHCREFPYSFTPGTDDMLDSHLTDIEQEISRRFNSRPLTYNTKLDPISPSFDITTWETN